MNIPKTDVVDVVRERASAGFGKIKDNVLDKYNLDDTKENRALIMCLTIDKNSV